MTIQDWGKNSRFEIFPLIMIINLRTQFIGPQDSYHKPLNQAEAFQNSGPVQLTGHIPMNPALLMEYLA